VRWDAVGYGYRFGRDVRDDMAMDRFSEICLLESDLSVSMVHSLVSS
jgi:hypothetical protein